ncbi:thioredoxin-like protein, partial [Baffinella frigidus]
SQGNKLVVVDWFAPWCGPCRGMAPHFEALAREHTDVVFAKVDTEASGENKALAMEATIRAYPTFHLYLQAQRV